MLLCAEQTGQDICLNRLRKCHSCELAAFSKVTSRKAKKDIEAHWPRFDEGRADFETRKCSGNKADLFVPIYSSTS